MKKFRVRKQSMFKIGPIKTNQKGIGLVEVIAALGIATVVIVSLASLSIFTLRANLQSKLLLQGSKLAEQELELVRALRDSTPSWKNDVDGFLDKMALCVRLNSNATNVCHMTDLTVVSGEGIAGSGLEQITTGFYLTYPESGNTDLVRVNVAVKWNIGGSDKYAHIYSDLSNWRGNN